jgi:Holliday junction resolvasome RuvABC ATP-dependent DNA helicase subunit
MNRLEDNAVLMGSMAVGKTALSCICDSELHGEIFELQTGTLQE